MKKLAITLSDEDFSMLEELRADKYCRRSKSHQIAWLILQEWDRLQQEGEKTPAELLSGMKAVVSLMEKKNACNPRIIQFPVRQFSGSA